MRIGVLALQGGFVCHRRMLTRLGMDAIEVRTSTELFSCDALILPGGESTTMTRLIEKGNLEIPLQQFAATHPTLGTCAGMILMARLKWITIEIERNAYGRQTASFATQLTLSDGRNIEALFIRAPKIQTILSSDVKILATYNGEPVFIQQGHHFATAFHPELTDDPTIHSLFIQFIREKGV